MKPSSITKSVSTPVASMPGVLGRSEKSDEVDLKNLISVLWRGKWFVLLAMIVGIALGVFYLVGLATPKFTASTVVMLETRNEQIVDFDSVLSGIDGDQTAINSEVEVLKARGLIEQLVVKLQLENDPEFNVYLRDPSPYSPVVLIKSALGMNEERPEPTARRVRDKVIDRLLDALIVINVRRSYAFRLTAETTDPEKSALIADTLAELYIEDQVAVKAQATETATRWLTDQVTKMEGELEAAENAAKAYSTGTNLISPEALAGLNRQLKDFRDRRSDTNAQMSALEAQFAALRLASESGDPAQIAEVADDPALVGLVPRLASGGEALRKTFDDRVNALLGRLQTERDRMASQSVALNRSIDELETRITAQSDELLKLQQLEREAKAALEIYEYFLGRLKETAVQRGIQQADSRILSAAVVPEQASSPKKLLVLAFTALLGLVAGSGYLLLREMRTNVFRTPDELEFVTGTAVIGQIPQAPNAKRKKLLEYIATKPTSVLAEAVRNLRTSILLANVDEPPQLIMLTSSVPDEGKTTQSLALAQNLASMDKKVLVIEGDIRRRTFRQYFDVADGHPGLLTAVTGKAPLTEIVYRDKNLGFDILMGEKSTINAADFFSSKRFAGLLDKVRATYDIVIIDTPPVLVVPDARVIGQLADAILYVVRWDRTPQSQVLQGIRAFEMVNTPVTGLILSQIDPKGMKRYGHGEAYGGASGRGYYDN